MQILVVLIFLVLLTGHVQAEKSCDADPRYLLVTVTGRQLLFKNAKTTKFEEVKLPEKFTKRIELLDRCDGYTFSHTPYPTKEFENDDMGNTTATKLTYEDGGAHSIERLRIRESLSDLCRAMKDCVDATK